MKAFLEEYGVAILVLAVVFVLIAMVTPLGDIVLNGFKSLFGSLMDVSNTGNSKETVEEATTAVSHLVQNFRM